MTLGDDDDDVVNGDGRVDECRLADGDVVLLLLKHWRVVVLVSKSDMNLFVARPETLRFENK